MYEKYSINKIILRGTVSATRVPSKTRVIYSIATDGDIGSSVFPQIIHHIKAPKDAWRVGERVTAICHARSGKVVTDDGKTIYEKQIVADSVMKTERILSSYIDDIPSEGTAPQDLNEFVFYGEVYRVTVNPGGRNAVLVTLKIPAEHKYYNYVEVSGFKHEAEVMKKARIGDRMAIAGSVRTIIKNKKVAFNYVAKDVYLKRQEDI